MSYLKKHWNDRVQRKETKPNDRMKSIANFVPPKNTKNHLKDTLRNVGTSKWDRKKKKT